MFTVLASMYCCCQWNITWLAVTLCPPQTGTVIYTRHLTFRFSGLLLRLTGIHLHLFLPTMSQQILACEGALWSHPHCYFFHSHCCLLTVITTNPCQLQEHESASNFCVVLLLALTEELAVWLAYWLSSYMDRIWLKTSSFRIRVTCYCQHL